MKKIRGCILIMLMAAMALQAQDLRKQGRYWVGTLDKTFKVETGGTLVVERVRGDVIIKTWSKNEIAVHEIKRMDIFSKDEAVAAMEESESGY